LAAGALGGVEIHKLSDGSLAQMLSTGNSLEYVSSLVYSGAGDLLGGISDSTVYVWDVKNDLLLWSQDTGYSINQLAFSSDGSMLAAAHDENKSPTLESAVPIEIPLWNARDGGQLVGLQGPEQILFPGYSSLLFSLDDNYLIAAEGGGNIDVWSLTDNKLEYAISDDSLFMSWNPILALSPDNKHFATGSLDRQIRLWKIGNKTVIRTLDAKDEAVTALAYSPDGDAIASGVRNEIHLWNAVTGKFLCSIHGSGDTLQNIFFTGDGLRFVSLAEDGIIRVWDVVQ
jgi:WD40 repeat protein